MLTLLHSRLTVLTEDVGGMMRNWTITSALSHLRAFVEGPTVRAVNQEDIQRFVVTTEPGARLPSLSPLSSSPGRLGELQPRAEVAAARLAAHHLQRPGGAGGEEPALQ